MTTIESTGQAKRFADAALAELARFGVPPTPNNYLIWYSHCSGSYPDLSNQLKVMAESEEGFTEDRLAALHERFFGTGKQVRLLNETCERIETTMSQVLSQVGGMSQDAGEYGDKLASFGDALSDGDQAPDLRGLVSGILEETRQMQDRAQLLERGLEASTQQIEVLRADLATAQREASTDGLTGIPNRKCFDQELRDAADEASAEGQPLCLLLTDIDHFKKFNDTYGHQVGDQVLRLVAQVLTRSVKGRDLAARYGGEEFGVVLPQTDLEGARKLGEQIRQTVAKNRIRLKSSGEDLGNITLSVGGAQYIPGEPLSDLIERADAALYQAKREGRNRVIVNQSSAAAKPAA